MSAFSSSFDYNDLDSENLKLFREIEMNSLPRNNSVNKDKPCFCLSIILLILLSIFIGIIMYFAVFLFDYYNNLNIPVDTNTTNHNTTNITLTY